MARLTTRQRVFWGAVALGTVPLAAALVVLAAQTRPAGPAAAARATLDDIAESNRALITALDTTALDSTALAVLNAHTEAIARSTVLARRAQTLTATVATVLGAVVLGAAVVLVALSLWAARRWAAYISRPIEDLVDRVRRIQRSEPLPAAAGPGAPEFDGLRQALADMADALERAREQAVERERLVAFRETARRVAHEIRGPLTSMRLAIAQLPTGDPGRAVLEGETRRLDLLARDFAEFGRLAEGPAADVDVVELIREVTAATLPPDRAYTITAPDAIMLHGRYEALRRAVQNLLTNAHEASPAEGGVDITITSEPDAVRIAVRDTGPGVPPSLRERMFDPYVTSKDGGTGLGLAIVRHVADAHGGSVDVNDAPAGGTVLTLSLPRT